MTIRVRGILIREGKLLVIHRIKEGREYYVIPGGGVENQETMLEALKREMKEEVGIIVSILDENPIYTFQDEESHQLFYLAQYV